jgi:flavin reductase (DIM6/NTAB) family NADH-FMN oxidoreductase RutF
MLIQPGDLRQAMRHWTTGVTVVTSLRDGERYGMTVSSFTSLSLEPPLVLVSLQQGTRTQQAVAQSKVFAVTVLAGQQQDLADCFAGRRCDDQYRFDGIATEVLVSGAPFFPGGLAWFDCRVVSTYEIGTHSLFVGEVIAVRSEEGAPLLYHNRAYRALC